MELYAEPSRALNCFEFEGTVFSKLQLLLLLIEFFGGARNLQHSAVRKCVAKFVVSLLVWI